MARPTLVQQIPVATELQREAHVGQQLPALASDGLSEAASSWSQQFARVGHEVGKLADHAAAVEGAQAGHLAGMDPEFRPVNNMTIRGEAFDKSAMQTYLARAHVGIVNDVEAAQMKHQADPAALQSVLNAKRAGWLGQAPRELHPEIDTLFAKTSAAAFRETTRAMWGRQAAELKGATVEQMDRHTRDAQQRAYGMGLDPAADRSAASDVDAFATMLARRGIDGNYLIPPVQQAHELAKFKENQVISRITGVFGRLPSLEAKAEFATRFDEGFAKGGTESPIGALAKDLDIGTFKSISASLRQELGRDLNQRKAQQNEIADGFKRIEKLALDGNVPPPQDMAAFRSRVAVDAPHMLAAFGVLEKVAEQSRGWQASTPMQLEGVVRAYRAEIDAKGWTDERAAYLKAAEGILGNMRAGLKDDPIGWAERARVIPKMAAIDLARPDTISARVAQAETIQGIYGSEVKYLRPDERRILAAELAKGGDQAIDLAGRIAAGAGDRAPLVFAELGGGIEKHAGVVARMGQLVAQGGDKDFIKMVANGLAWDNLPDNAKTRMTKMTTSEMYAAAGDVITPALPDQERVALMGITNVAYEMYAQRAKPASFEAKVWQDLFRKALGEREIGGEKYGGAAVSRPGRLWGGSNAVPIPPNVKQSQFMKLLDAIEPTDLVDAMGNGPRYGDGRQATAAEIRGAALLPAAEAGFYKLVVGHTPTGVPRVLKDGRDQDFVLDLNALEPVLRRRRPDAYLGGR